MIHKKTTMPTKNKEKKVTIVLDEGQLLNIQEACEYMSRHLSGQFDYLDPFEDILLRIEGMSVFGNDATREASNILKKEIFDLHPNQFIGIGGSCLKSQVAYEIYREIRRYFLKKNPDNGFSVYNSETMKYSGKDLINITPNHD